MILLRCYLIAESKYFGSMQSCFSCVLIDDWQVLEDELLALKGHTTCLFQFHVRLLHSQVQVRLQFVEVVVSHLALLLHQR
jgi:hypothetical protein